MRSARGSLPKSIIYIDEIKWFVKVANFLKQTDGPNIGPMINELFVC